MAVQSEKSFRISPIGGFNRQDVLEFITNITRERQDEVEAYRAGADKLRGERDAFREEAGRLAVEKTRAEALASDLSQEKERSGALEKDLERVRLELDGLRADLAHYQSRLASFAEENKALRLRLEQFEAEASNLGDVKMRLEDMEMKAYRRAEAIEAEAAQNAMKARASLLHSVAEMKTRYDAVFADSETCAYSVVKELDKMRDWFAHFTDMFDSVGAQLAAMANATQPVVRDFVPEEFDEEL